MRAAGVPADSPMAQLNGKRLLPVLYGRTVTSNPTDRNKMDDVCRKEKIECWDVSGSGVETSSTGCYKSPYVHPFHTDRGSTTATAMGKASTGPRVGTVPVLPRMLHSHAFRPFSSRSHAMLGQRGLRPLY